MKCLTRDESQKWLEPLKVTINSNWELMFPSEQQKVMMTFPKEAPALNFFSARLGRWLTRGSDRLLWLSHWDTCPRYPMHFFEAIRSRGGEQRHIIEAPGHVFTALDRSETALMSGLMFLVLSFRWEAFIVSQNPAEFVYLGDQCVICSSPIPQKMKRVEAIMTTFGVRAIQDIREAWI